LGQVQFFNVMQRMNTTTAIFVSVPGKTDAGPKPVRLRRYIDRRKSYFLFKRLADIIVSLLVTVLVLSWLLPVIALLIKLDSRGPVFFLQRRVGRGGRSFVCLKLRTMIPNDVSDTMQATADDQRITRFGKWLRASNIDEFPQFINVLLGSMSLVGPRPHMYADCDRFSSCINGYKFRHFVKPGITGLAQVKGYHGPTQDSDSIVGRYQWDACYIRHVSPVLDIKILVETISQQVKGILTTKSPIPFEESASYEQVIKKVS